MKNTNNNTNKILIIKEKIDALTKELDELVKEESMENKNALEKKLASVKKKFEKKWVSVLDTNDYIYIKEITDIVNSNLITIDGVLLTVGQDYNDYDDGINDITGFDYEISDFKVIKNEKVISEIENEKKNRIAWLDKMIKKVNSIQ